MNSWAALQVGALEKTGRRSLNLHSRTTSINLLIKYGVTVLRVSIQYQSWGRRVKGNHPLVWRTYLRAIISQRGYKLRNKLCVWWKSAFEYGLGTIFWPNATTCNYGNLADLPEIHQEKLVGTLSYRIKFSASGVGRRERKRVCPRGSYVICFRILL